MCSKCTPECNPQKREAEENQTEKRGGSVAREAELGPKHGKPGRVVVTGRPVR